jgi:N-acetylglucosamine-6-sulfatase
MTPISKLVPIMAAGAGLLLAANGPASGQDAAEPPNIVFVLTDDEDLLIHPYMPKVKALIEDQGVVFENAFVTYPLCCPSRTSILRGQYPHNTRVLGNLPPQGGFKAFRRLELEHSTIATWLQDAGYRTAFYGKFLNGYTERDAPMRGFDEWHAVNNDGYFNFGYKLNENGEVMSYGHAPEDYLSDVMARKAARHIRRFSAEGRPFFLFLATTTPHSPYVPAPRHKGLFKDAALPRPPSFNEADVGDKPRFIRELPRLTEKEIDEITTIHRARLEGLQAVDEMVETLVRTLEEVGELDQTYVVYASDNGFHLGLHRLKAGKDTAFEEDIRVPLAVRGPGVPKGRRIGAMVLNTDFAPTFAAMAGVTPTDFVDGRSFLPLFENPDQLWRQSFMIRRVGLETDKRLVTANAIAIRTQRHTFVAYEGGERALYDLEHDPHQLVNIVTDTDPALIDRLSTRLTGLNACAAQTCREFEDAPIDQETTPGRADAGG